jgi:succinate dehydrogenase/fumarate reductase flavoprotein subunit
LLEEKSIQMDRLSQEIKKRKEELNRWMTEKMEYSRNEKEMREKLTMIQYEITKMEEDLRKLTSKVFKIQTIQIN